MKGSVIVQAIVFVLLIYIGYKVIIYYKIKQNTQNQKEIIGSETLFDETYSYAVNRGDLFEPNNNFSITWMMKVLNIPSNFHWNSSFDSMKPIILNGGCPDIYYHPKENKLMIQFQFLNADMSSAYKDIIIKNIKIQSWGKYALIVKSRVVNFYINGQLEYSFMLPTVPMLPNGPLRLGSVNNNFLGYINKVIYYNYPLKMSEIQ